MCFDVLTCAVDVLTHTASTISHPTAIKSYTEAVISHMVEEISHTAIIVAPILFESTVQPFRKGPYIRLMFYWIAFE